LTSGVLGQPGHQDITAGGSLLRPDRALHGSDGRLCT
jgi:hypothetical protein